MKVAYTLALMLLISACTTTSEAATQTIVPTLLPTKTILPTPTPQLQVPVGVVALPQLNIRSGPGREFLIIGFTNQGVEFYILGEYNDVYGEQWLIISLNDESFGWINGESRFVSQKLATVDNVTYNTLINLKEQARDTYSQQGIFREYVPPSNLIAQSPTSVPTLPAPPSSSIIECKDAKDKVGSFVSCKIPYAYCSYQAATSGSPTFCNEAPYPSNNFVFVIWGQDWSEYNGNCIIVSGTISLYQGTLQIEGTSRSQVSYCK